MLCILQSSSQKYLSFKQHSVNWIKTFQCGTLAFKRLHHFPWRHLISMASFMYTLSWLNLASNELLERRISTFSTNEGILCDEKWIFQFKTTCTRLNVLLAVRYSQDLQRICLKIQKGRLVISGLRKKWVPQFSCVHLQRSILVCYGFVSILNTDSVTCIYVNAFKCCYRLRSVIIPISVDFMGANPFAECSSLSDLVFVREYKRFKVVDGALYDRKCLVWISSERID